MTTERTLVLRGSPGDEEQLAAINRAIEALLEQDNLAYRYADSESPDDDTTIYRWFGTRREDLIQLIDDLRIPARYLTVRARDPERARAVAAKLASSLPAISLSELLSEAEARAAESPGALVRLALGTDGRFNDEAARVIGAALAHEAAPVRRAAAKAAALLSWSRLAPALQAAANVEKDAAARRLLDYALLKCGVE